VARELDQGAQSGLCVRERQRCGELRWRGGERAGPGSSEWAACEGAAEMWRVEMAGWRESWTRELRVGCVLRAREGVASCDGFQR
jgi:hypothetical protein